MGPMTSKAGDQRGRGPGIAFLLTQVGTSAAEGFAQVMDDLDVTPPVAGVLRAIAAEPGRTQQALATQLGMVPSGLVALLDGLEQGGNLERRRNPADRRSHALYLTRSGQALLRRIGAAAERHDAAVVEPLTDKERDQLLGMLRRLAEHQGLTPGVHPGHRHIRSRRNP